MEKYGLIGKKLGHSYSKMIHEKFGDYQYDLCETEEAGLQDLLHSKEYGGFNITIPYKKQAMDFCDILSPEVKKIGSVNTVVKREGLITGYNTDYFGFSFLVNRKKIEIKGKKCLVLGSGGASLTVQAALSDMGAGEVVVISRSGENNYDNLDRHFDGEIIINTTPVGMYPHNGKSPVDMSKFTKCQGVLDLIYNPNKTKLVLDALQMGIPAGGGLSMLVAQACKASELFRGTQIEEEAMLNVLEEVKRETMNMILIGMPGAGKTMLGKQMAKRMGRRFVDVDDLIVEREGMSIPNIFDQKGEAYFRKVETEILEEACIQSGLVIATGGGIVKKKVNYHIIKQNGFVIWIKRDLEKLETDGRPLSQTMPLEEMYEERKDAYASWSEYFINNNEERE